MKGSRHLSPVFELQLSPNPEGWVAPGSGAASAQRIGEWVIDAMFWGTLLCPFVCSAPRRVGLQRSGRLAPVFGHCWRGWPGLGP